MDLKLHRSKKRQIALIAGAIVLVCYVAGQIAVLRPMRKAARAKERELTRKTGELGRKGWPLDHNRLQVMLAETSRKQDIAETRRGAVLYRAGVPFREKIMRRYETPEHFQKQVTRLDYQEEYKRLENYLKSKDIAVAPHVFKLSEDTVGLDNYKLVLQLWTMQTVVETALAKGLSVADVPFDESTLLEGQPKPPRASDLGALAIVPYLAAPHIKEPYLLRIPVRLNLVGDVSQLYDFLQAAGRDDVFFNIDHLEGKKPIPPGTDFNNRRVEAEVECSTFYILDSETGRQLLSKPKAKVLRRGA